MLCFVKLNTAVQRAHPITLDITPVRDQFLIMYFSSAMSALKKHQEQEEDSEEEDVFQQCKCGHSSFLFLNLIWLLNGFQLLTGSEGSGGGQDFQY